MGEVRLSGKASASGAGRIGKNVKADFDNLAWHLLGLERTPEHVQAHRAMRDLLMKFNAAAREVAVLKARIREMEGGDGA